MRVRMACQSATLTRTSSRVARTAATRASADSAVWRSISIQTTDSRIGPGSDFKRPSAARSTEMTGCTMA